MASMRFQGKMTQLVNKLEKRVKELTALTKESIKVDKRTNQKTNTRKMNRPAPRISHVLT